MDLTKDDDLARPVPGQPDDIDGDPGAGAYAAARRRSARRDRSRRLISGAIGIAAAIVIWQIVSDAYNLKLLLPPPWTVAVTLFKVITVQDNPWPYGGNLYTHLLTSLAHAGIGFGVSAVIAVPLGLLVGRVRWLSESVGVVLKLLYPVPGVAWIPLTILWFGLGPTAIIFVVGITTFFPLYYNTEAGARYADQALTDTARCFGLRGLPLLAEVVVPASLPHIVTGLRLSIGEAWRTIVAAEIIAGQVGIGYILQQSQLFFRASDLLSFMIVISLVGYGSQLLIAGTLERHTIQKWGGGR